MATLIENIPIGITFNFYEFIDEHVRGDPNEGFKDRAPRPQSDPTEGFGLPNVTLFLKTPTQEGALGPPPQNLISVFFLQG